MDGQLHLPESNSEGRIKIYGVIDRKIGDCDCGCADIHIVTIRSELYRTRIYNLTDKVQAIRLWRSDESECGQPRAIVLQIESDILQTDHHETSRKAIPLWGVISNIDDLYNRLIIIGQLLALSNDILFSNEEDVSSLGHERSLAEATDGSTEGIEAVIDTAIKEDVISSVLAQFHVVDIR